MFPNYLCYVNRCGVYFFEIVCGDDSFVLRRTVQANIVFSQMFDRKENPRHGDTFWSINLVSFDGFR